MTDGCNGVPDRTRTCDPQFRKLLLYPAELRGHIHISIAYSSGTDPRKSVGGPDFARPERLLARHGAPVKLSARPSDRLPLPLPVIPALSSPGLVDPMGLRGGVAPTGGAPGPIPRGARPDPIRDDRGLSGLGSATVILGARQVGRKSHGPGTKAHRRTVM